MAKYFYEQPCGKVDEVELSADEQKILTNVTLMFRDKPRIAAKIWLTETEWYTEQEVDEFLADESMCVYQIFCNHTQNDYAEIKALVNAYKNYYQQIFQEVADANS